MTAYLYSTLSCDQCYRTYAPGAADMPRVERSIVVAGKANVADKNFRTPRGVVTRVNDDDLAALEGIELFQTHVANGYIKVERQEARDVDKAVSDLQGRDASAPLVDADFEGTDADPAPAAEKRGPGRPRKDA